LNSFLLFVKINCFEFILTYTKYKVKIKYFYGAGDGVGAIGFRGLQFFWKNFEKMDFSCDKRGSLRINRMKGAAKECGKDKYHGLWKGEKI